MFDVRHHIGFGHGLKPGTTEDINCRSCQREKADGVTPNITKAGEPFRLDGCTCPPDHRAAWHFKTCQWAER